MANAEFQLAGAEMDWPIGSAPGLTNHPDIEMVANRFDDLTTTGLSFTVLGSWTVGEARGGNGYVWTEDHWEYVGGDEYVDLDTLAGYNSKGLPGPGTDIGMERLDDFVDLAASRGVETGLSLSPHAGEPLEELKEIIALAGKALTRKVLFVEVNLSCPNVPGRPPFYQDTETLRRFYDYVDGQPLLLNKNGRPGVYFKDGPLDIGTTDVKDIPSPPKGYGRVTSNTLGNQEPQLASGDPAITVNNGKAGMSGPALNALGRDQLILRLESVRQSDHPDAETISVLGVDSGEEVAFRHSNLGATAVELGSVLYWPVLVGCDSAGEVVEKIKQEFVEVA